MHLLWEYKALTFNQEPWQNRIFPQHRWLVKQIKRLKPVRILEVGCGFGRNLQFLIKQGISPEKLVGVDFSFIMLLKARRKLKNRVKLIRAGIQALPFKSNSFPLVFTHGVLMHLPPSAVKPALRELSRISSQYLILIEEISPRPKKLNRFTWAHDYEKIIRELNSKVKLKKTDSQLNLVWYLIQTS